MARKKILIANWKAYIETVGEAERLFGAVKNASTRLRNTTVVICPPFAFLDAISHNYRGKSLLFGAQDVFGEERGAHTGAVIASMLGSVGADYVIIGHSEVRARGDTNENVNKKIHTALSAKLRVILCIGEKERDHSGDYLEFLGEQLKSALVNVDESKLPRMAIAYEPIWAIGKSAEYAMTPTQVHEMVLFIRKVLSHKYEKKNAFRVPILYGGSVERENVVGLFTYGEVNGFLVGHASVNAEEFAEMMVSVDRL
jgi:triosephosphate isomerase (TIM)